MKLIDLSREKPSPDSGPSLTSAGRGNRLERS
jgi:hypothetical protein